MLDLSEIRSVTDKATAGPWENKTNAHPQCNGEPWGWIARAGGNIRWGGYRGQVNADFIAHARQWVPALCDEVERLQSDCNKIAIENAVLERALELAADATGTGEDLGLYDYWMEKAGFEIQRAREEMEK